MFVAVMGLSIAATVWFLLGDFGPFTKIAVVLLTGLALCLQWIPGLAGQVHFLVPLLMQIFVCIWWSFARVLE